MWDRLARFVANGDETVIEGVGDVSGIGVCFVVVDDGGGGRAVL